MKFVLQNVSKLVPYNRHDVKFNIIRFAKATIEKNCAWHFIGSFSLEIHPYKSCDYIKIKLTNNSSFKSFSYGVGPNWSSGPMSNINQTYEWTEKL